MGNGEGGEGGAGGTGGGTGGGVSETVPYSRFQTVVGEKQALANRVAELERENQGLQEKAATADTLAGQLRTAQAEKASTDQRFETFKAITSAGLTDPELVEAAEWAHSRLPEKDRPPIGEWLSGLREDPSKAPLVLRPHLGEGTGGAGGGGQGGAGGQGAAGGGGQGGAGGQGGGAPSANNGTRPFTGAPSTLTPQQIAALSPEEYKAQREAILANLT